MIRDYLSNFILRAPQSSGRSARFESQIPDPEPSQLFIRARNETAATPTAFLRLSAVDSQLFSVPLLTI